MAEPCRRGEPTTIVSPTSTEKLVCTTGRGESNNSSDCDDKDAGVYPGNGC